MGYSDAKNLLSLTNDYYVFFEDRNAIPLEIDSIKGVGKPGVNITNLNATEHPTDIIKIYRFVIYNSTMVRMGIYLW